mmetsp:Transcript_54277/g.142939  ORF Transcript_54277/g.142939 Transcript_54277/m.142939 type:complete len:203 (-) Transcript_54277:44-652(-)
MGKHKAPDTKKDKKKNRKGPVGEKEADAETARQVKEIEERLSEISYEMNKIDASVKRYAIEAKRAELTVAELDRIGDSSKIYRQVGKMFILQPKDFLERGLKATTALKSVESMQMQQARGKLEAKARTEADGLRELIGAEKFKQLFQNQGQMKDSFMLPGSPEQAGEQTMALFKLPGSKAGALPAVAEEAAEEAPAEKEAEK